MKRLIVLLGIVTINFLFAAILYAGIANATSSAKFSATKTLQNSSWQTVGVTAYSPTHDRTLTGCSNNYDSHGERICYTACPAPLNILHDREFTVAANPRMGFHCGDKLRFLKWENGRFYRHNALVTDTTACTLWFCDFEFSYSLALATGATPAGWDNPRHVSMKRGWGLAALQSRPKTLRMARGTLSTPYQSEGLKRLLRKRPKDLCPGALLNARYYRFITWHRDDLLQEVRTMAGYKANTRTRSCRAARQQAKNWKARAHTRLRSLVRLNDDIPAAIRYIFGDEADGAMNVAQCESGFSTTASNGQFYGIFQLGTSERSSYAIWRGAYRYTTNIDQVKAAYRLWQVSGFYPWQCLPTGGLRW